MKTKENLLTGYVLTVVTAILALIVTACIFFGSALTAHAEEITTYTYITTFGRKPYTTSDTWYYYTDTLTTHNPLVGYGKSGGPSGFLSLNDKGEVEAYIYRLGGIKFTAQDGSTWVSSSGYSFSPYFYAHESIETNIPLFTTKEEAENYLLTGDTSGQLNVPEISTDENLALLGFECDSSVKATWTGLSCGENVNIDDVLVSVVPSCFLILESGEIEQDFTLGGTVTVPYTDFVFEKAYSEYIDGNPYEGRLQLILTFIPSYIDAESNTKFNGQKIVVQFDENGKIKDMNLPSGSIDKSFSQDFYLKNFIASNTLKDNGQVEINCRWTGSSIDGVVNYNYSEIKVDLCVIDLSKENIALKWIPYEMDEIVSIRSNRLDFNLKEVDEWCRANGYSFWYDNQGINRRDELAIRITPYYKTNNTYVNGRSVKIELSKLGGINSTLESIGDATNDQVTEWKDLEEDYFDTHSPTDGLLENVFGEGENNDYSINNLPKDFLGMIKGFIYACGQFPSLIASVFSFLPSVFVNMLVVGLGLIILLRILGR